MKILIAKTSAMGDVLHTFPVVSYLRHHFPDARIDWVVETSLVKLVQAHPQVDRAIGVDTRLWRRGRFKGLRRAIRRLRYLRYDVVFDLQGNCKSALITLFARARKKVGFGARSVPEWPNVLVTNKRYNPPTGKNVRDDLLSVVAQHIGKPVMEPYPVNLAVSKTERELVTHLVGRKGVQIAVAPGSAWSNKRLPEVALVDFLERLSKKLLPHFLWVWGSELEHDLAHRLRDRFPEGSVVVPKLALPSLQHLLGRVDVVIGMDSLPLHLAGTTSTPTFSLFGPSSPTKYKPQGNHHHIQGACPYGHTFEKRCPMLRTCSTGACMDALTGERCFNTFMEWWQSSRRQTPSHPDKRPPLAPV